ncbi:hypothetical protein HDU93_006242, partial [Gonapodya sp. JEL0774]
MLLPNQQPFDANSRDAYTRRVETYPSQVTLTNGHSGAGLMVDAKRDYELGSDTVNSSNLSSSHSLASQKLFQQAYA